MYPYRALRAENQVSGRRSRGVPSPGEETPELPRRRRWRHHRERLRDLLTVLLLVARLDVRPRLQCLTLHGQRGREHDLGPIVEGDQPPARIDALDLALDVGRPGERRQHHDDGDSGQYQNAAHSLHRASSWSREFFGGRAATRRTAYPPAR